MKKAIFILPAGLFLLFIIGFLAKGPISLNHAATMPAVKTSVVVGETKTPLPTEMNISTTGTPLQPYEVLSPTKIKKDKLTFEASIELLNCAELSFLVNGTFPSDFFVSSPGSGDPAIFSDVELIASPPNISLKVDPVFGGGGGSDINNVHIRGQGSGYFINPPLNTSQELHVTAFVTFDQSYGIANPVPFNLHLIAQHCP